MAVRVAAIRDERTLHLCGTHEIGFEDETDLILHRHNELPYHPNGMLFTAFAADGEVVAVRTYYSIGGGFVVNEDAASSDCIVEDKESRRCDIGGNRGSQICNHQLEQFAKKFSLR